MERMNRLLQYDPVEGTVEVEAGMTIKALQDFAESKKLFYPIEYAATTGSQVGGNIATNAGGIQVIRYGMTRNYILGLKVITGKGESLNLNKGLQKKRDRI